MSLVAAIARRTRATIAGSLLAIPAASIATEPDSGQEGLVVPEQEGLGEQPGFDPGGDTALPFDAAPPPSGSPGSGSPDDAPVETEPTDDPDARVAPLAEPEDPGAGAGEGPGVAPIGGSPPAAPPDPGFAIEPAPPDSSLPTDQASSPDAQLLAAEPGSGANADDGRRQLLYRAAIEPHSQPSPTGGPSEAVASPAPDAGVETATASVAQTVAAETSSTNTSTSSTGARFHVVRPGESLWTIAERLLGDDASTAQIADQVERLWALNRERIASGDADLITAGTRLKLR